MQSTIIEKTSIDQRHSDFFRHDAWLQASHAPATLHDQSVAANSSNHHENLTLHPSSNILSDYELPLRDIKLVTIKVTGVLVFQLR